MCYLVMNGGTPVAVYASETKAKKHADRCDGFVVTLPFYK